MLAKLYKFLKQSKGATAIEYALIASLIAVVAITGMKLVGNSILNKMNNINEHMQNH
jgi:pilus assembly protein Flp/PilA